MATPVPCEPQGCPATAVWKQLVENTLKPPDTWEVALSAGKDKRENFERLQLGGAAKKFAAPLFFR